MAKEPKTYTYDDQFPDNVDPTDKNRREFSKQKEKEAEELKEEVDNRKNEG